MEQPSRNQLIESIVRVLEPRDEILEAYLFGSRARGASGPLADVDVAVFLDRTDAGAYPFGYPAELATVLMRELRTNAIDVVVLNGAPPLLYHRVLRDGVRLFSRNLQETTTREGMALSRYCDFVPQLRTIAAAQDARIAR